VKNFILILTASRIIVGPFILVFTFFEQYLICLFIFVFAALSDFLDGYLARKFNAESELGAILDPIGDKILLIFAMFSVTLTQNDFFTIFCISIIISREIWVSALREIQDKKASNSLTVSNLAKIKTSSQFFYIAIFYVGNAFDNQLIIFLSLFFLFIALILTVKTGLDYTSKFFMDIKKSKL